MKLVTRLHAFPPVCLLAFFLFFFFHYPVVSPLWAIYELYGTNNETDVSYSEIGIPV